ncbi:MAG: response regulator [Verrucomicrobiota bacterium]
MTGTARQPKGLPRLWRRERSFVLLILQLGLFLLGFALLVGLHHFVLERIEELDATSSNEEARLILAQQINLNLASMESEFYEIATSTGLRRQKQIENEIQDQISDIRKILNVLNDGGTYHRAIPVNLEFREFVSNPITYHRMPGQSEYVLESIDLAPKLEEIEQKVQELLVYTSLRDNLRNSAPGSAKRAQYVEAIAELKAFLKRVPPLFMRMQANANRIHAESIRKFKELSQATQSQKVRYRLLEFLVAAITLLTVVLFGWVIAQHIRHTNAALRHATEQSARLKDEAEEAQRHNAALNRILEVSILDMPLQETLQEALIQIMSVPWLRVESQGSIFLADPAKRELTLAVHHNLAPELQGLCAVVPYGKCLCGKAAERGAPVFAAHMDGDHDIRFPGIHEHGHICMPINSRDGLLGVLNLYVLDGSERSAVNERFLQVATKTLATIIERKRAEDMLRKLSIAVEQSPATVVITDIDGNIEYVNPMFTEKTGYTAEEAIGQNPRILKSDGTPSETYEDLWKTLTSGDIWRGEFLTKKKNGDLYWEAASISPIRTKTGRATHYVAVKEDVTERKRIEEELRRATAMAEQASRAKGDFLANMSHEIRTPMNAVIGLSYLALKSDLDDRQRDYLSKIQISAKALLGIINDILDFSKIEAGHMAVEAIPFRLDKVINQVFTVAGVKAAEKGLDLFVVPSMDLPASIIGDPLRLGQVLTNLVGNAVKFTEQGEVILSVKAVESGDDALTLRFCVEDSGIGITKEKIGKLFNSFSQADTSTTRKYGGSGLGLVISDRLVKLMGGELQVESEPGKGSAFSFTARFAVDDTEKKERLGERSFLVGKRACVFSDNATARHMYERMLTAHGLKVATFANADGLKEAMDDDSLSCDVLVVDLRSPKIDDSDIAQHIRSAYHESLPPVVVLVGFDAGRNAEILDSQPQCEVLTKPVSPSTLLDTIARLFGRSVTPSGAMERPARDVDAIQGILGARALVAEDVPINQLVAQEVLEGFGAEVTIAENGKIAVEKIREEQFDIVFMDVQMPEMDGYEATALIRSDRRFDDLPIIAMTAHALDSDREKSLAMGMNGHVSKPIDPEDLFDTLSRWVRIQRHAE